jgi:hypothetical protein
VEPIQLFNFIYRITCKISLSIRCEWAWGELKRESEEWEWTEIPFLLPYMLKAKEMTSTSPPPPATIHI